MDVINRSWREPYDPPAPRWLVRLCVGLMLYTLLTYLDALYAGRWGWACLDALGVLVNAYNAYFNTLPVSQRMRLLMPFRACPPAG
jgi:hypothetical protein